VVNPTIPEMERSLLDLRLAGTAEAILMVEAGANEVSEELMLEALRLGHQAIQDVIAVQHEMRQAVGKPKRAYVSHAVPEELIAQVREHVGDRLLSALYDAPDKAARNAAINDLMNELKERFGETTEPLLVWQAFEEVTREVVRRRILEDGIRVDGRDPYTIRPPLRPGGPCSPAPTAPASSRAAKPRSSRWRHWGTPREEQLLDDLSPEETKRYMHHYNFPPFSTGETRPLRGPGRREIGHGALAERALLPVIPPEDEFPYTIRVVSEVLSSNGSTSMASVCGSTLALMDAGVPIRTHVAGIAMGLVMEGDRYRILTDILGMEDHLGDMDFKVAGTEKGITALQMDIKIKGISDRILAEALEQARQARLQILDVLRQTIPAPRPELSPYAPRMLILHVDPDKLGAVIGTGGKTVRAIQEECDVKVDIEDDGTIYIASTNRDGACRAEEIIRRLTEVPAVGKVYTGRVVRITDFGVFVELAPGTDGMVHISQLSDQPIKNIRDAVDIGDEIMVMVTDIDPDGKIRLSRRAVLEGWTPEEARMRGPVAGEPGPGGPQGAASSPMSRRCRALWKCLASPAFCRSDRCLTWNSLPPRPRAVHSSPWPDSCCGPCGNWWRPSFRPSSSPCSSMRSWPRRRLCAARAWSPPSTTTSG
jgi:polyribonucleotide nucleotidyltransferase